MKFLKLITFFTILILSTQLIAGKNKKHTKAKRSERPEQRDGAAAAAASPGEESDYLVLQDLELFLMTPVDGELERLATEEELSKMIKIKTLSIWKTLKLSALKTNLSKRDFEALKRIFRVLSAAERLRSEVTQARKDAEEKPPLSDKEHLILALDLKSKMKALPKLSYEDLAWLKANMDSIYYHLFPCEYVDNAGEGDIGVTLCDEFTRLSHTVLDEFRAQVDAAELNAADIFGAPRITDTDVDNFIRIQLGELPDHQVDRDPIRGLDLDRLDLDPENRFPEAGL